MSSTNSFTPESVTIKNLFCNSDSLYVIPNYQRPYSWTDEQVEKMWEDLWEAFQNEKANEDEGEDYFLGSIIVSKSKGSDFLEVIDGQQRLTAMTILISALKYNFPELNSEIDNSLMPSIVTKRTLENSIFYEGTDRLVFKAHNIYNGDFRDVIIKNDLFIQIKKPTVKQLKDISPKYKFQNTAYIFNQKFTDPEVLNEVGSFANYIYNKVRIIKIVSTNSKFGIKLFQVLNNRGLDLSATDLLKSYLLAEVKDYDQSEFIALWNDLEKLVSQTDNGINDFFTFYLYYNLAANPKKSLEEELERIFKGKDSLSIINDIKTFVEKYNDQIFESHNKEIYALRYLPWEFYWKSILITALHTHYEEYEELISSIRRFYYSYWIAGDTLSKIKQTSFNIIKLVKEKKPINEIKQILNDKLLSDNVLNRLSANVKLDVYNTMWIKSMLLNFEYNSTDEINPKFIEIKPSIHVEHIIPIQHSKYEEWNTLPFEFRENSLNTISNLTLLSGIKNIEASNNPFAIKVNVYKGNGKHLDKDGKITSFNITRKIVEDFDSNKYNNEWNVKAANHRAEWFMQNLSKFLGLDIIS